MSGSTTLICLDLGFAVVVEVRVMATLFEFAVVRLAVVRLMAVDDSDDRTGWVRTSAADRICF